MPPTTPSISDNPNPAHYTCQIQSKIIQDNVTSKAGEVIGVARFSKCIQILILIGVSCIGSAAAHAEQRSAIDDASNRVSLTDFGVCNTSKAASLAYRKAIKQLMSQGGGVLVIPTGVAKDFKVVNDAQRDYRSTAVTVFDYRGGAERIYVPAMGTAPSLAGIGTAGQIIERELDRNLPATAVVSTQQITSFNRGGSSSYSQKLTRASMPGNNARIDVPTLRGLYVGQMLRISGIPGAYGGKVERVVVKSLGQDTLGPYFTADVSQPRPKDAIVYAKTIVNALTLNDLSNADNQSMSLVIKRATYGTGDTFGNWTQLDYQGDLMSGGGDEGGVAYTAEIIQDLIGFRALVESWDPSSGTLVYAAAGATDPHKLGTSRPIINLNPKKWQTSGTVQVVAAGYNYLRGEAASTSLIVGSRDANWDRSLVGRFIAIDEPSERYEKGEQWSSALAGPPHPVHRWYSITSVERLANGQMALYVESQWWGTNRRGGPRLMDAGNYTTSSKDSHKLRYIIAPGAWASDVREGVAGYRPGNVWRATNDDARKIILAPAPFFQSSIDFASGDPITQPPAAEAWLPTGYRVRHFNGFKGLMSGASFHTRNAGRVQIGSGLLIDSSQSGTLDAVLKQQKDRRTHFEYGVDVRAVTSSALRIRGAVKDAALDLWSVDGNEKKLRWRLSPKVGRWTTSIHADPGSGRLVLDSAGLDLSHSATLRQTGISGTDTAAKNLRGIDVAVGQGLRELTVSFPASRQELDGRYSVTVQPSWMTRDAVVEKTAKGFRVAFSEPAPGNAKIDWQLIR